MNYLSEANVFWNTLLALPFFVLCQLFVLPPKYPFIAFFYKITRNRLFTNGTTKTCFYDFLIELYSLQEKHVVGSDISLLVNINLKNIVYSIITLYLLLLSKTFMLASLFSNRSTAVSSQEYLRQTSSNIDGSRHKSLAFLPNISSLVTGPLLRDISSINSPTY